MSNTYEKFYGYTGFFPILKDSHSEESHTLTLRKLLHNLPNDGGSLFSRTGLVHGARLFILDDVIYNGHPAPEEHLEYEYLVLSISFDGQLDDFTSKLAEVGVSELNDIFSHCYCFENVALSPDEIHGFIKAGQVTTSFFYVEADGNLQETLRALLAQKLIAEMLEQGQFLPTPQKKELVLATIAKISAAKLPLAGNFTL